MFNFFKKTRGSSITLKLSGLDCVACSLNIDESLEEIHGVITSKTSYAKQLSQITYDPKLVSPSKFRDVIQSLGYQVLA